MPLPRTRTDLFATVRTSPRRCVSGMRYAARRFLRGVQRLAPHRGACLIMRAARIIAFLTDTPAATQHRDSLDCSSRMTRGNARAVLPRRAMAVSRLPPGSSRFACASCALQPSSCLWVPHWRSGYRTRDGHGVASSCSQQVRLASTEIRSGGALGYLSVPQNICCGRLCCTDLPRSCCLAPSCAAQYRMFRRLLRASSHSRRSSRNRVSLSRVCARRLAASDKRYRFLLMRSAHAGSAAAPHITPATRLRGVYHSTYSFQRAHRWLTRHGLWRNISACCGTVAPA